MPMAPQSKVHFQELANNITVATSGGGTSWESIELDGPEAIGPWLEQVTSHTRLRSPTTNLEVRGDFFWSIDGSEWTGPFTLFAATGTEGQAVSAPYTTVANFGRRMRYVLSYRASAGTASESGTVSWGCAFQFKS